MNEPGTRAGRRRQERRSPFRSSLVIEPFWRRALLAAVAVGVYAAAFTPLYARGGVGVTALSIFPVVILGWLFGSWGGLLSGVLVVPLNAMLLGFVGEPGWQIVVGAGVRRARPVPGVACCVYGRCPVFTRRHVGPYPP